MVDNKTIQRILSFIYQTEYGSHAYHYSYVRGRLEELNYNLSEEGLSELGTDMLSLNRAAVNDRYNEEVGVVEVFKFSLNLQVSKIQVLKSIQCYLYQCAEGDIPERELYKVLRQLEVAIMHSIINAMPEYEAATWG